MKWRPTQRRRRRKKNRIMARVSIGLNEQEMDALNRALVVRYGEDSVRYGNRGTFLRLRLGKEYFCGMLACDVRKETPEECAARNGEPKQQQLALPDNIIALFG